MTTPPAGTGQRFSLLAQQLAAKPGVRNPQALAAAIGRKKFGANRFAQLSHKQ